MSPQVQCSIRNPGEITSVMATRMTQADAALLTYTDGTIDAVLDQDGRTYLLRPAQEKLRESESRLRAVVESSADVITLLNRGGVILSQSQAARRVLGHASEDSVGRRFFEYIHESDIPGAHSAFLSVMEGLCTDRIVQFRHRAPDDSYRVVEASVSRLCSGSDPTVIFCLRAANTSLKQTEPASSEIDLVNDSIAKDRFIAVLSHELRTPLTPALLAVSMLHEDECRVEVKATLEMIKRNLQMASDLIDELRNFVGVGHHKVRLDLEPVDAHDAIRSAVEICRSDLKAAQVEVHFDFRAANYCVEADPLRLQQVIWNLLKNAVKFSPPLSSISISTSNDAAGQIAIEFLDHGIGIESGLLPLIFDPFRQRTAGVGEPSGGLGLGLYIAKGLVEAHQATLTVASEGSGQGSVFRLVFPTAHQAGAIPIAGRANTATLQ